MVLNYGVNRLSVLAALAVFSAVAQAAPLTLTVPAASGSVGSEVKVPLNVTGAGGCGALQLELTFDPAVLEVKEVEEGALLSGALLTNKVTRPGCLKIALVSQKPLTGDGVLAVVKFQVKAGGQSPLGLSGVRAWDHTSTLEMLVSATPGRFAEMSTPGQSNAGTSLPLWAIIGGSAAVVVILLLVILKARRKKGPSVNQ